MRFLVSPGRWLWYRNKYTGYIEAVQVISVGPKGFSIRYKDKIYTQPYAKIGKVFFYTSRGAADPSAILEKPDSPSGKAPKYSDREIDILSESDEYYRMYFDKQAEDLPKK